MFYRTFQVLNSTVLVPFGLRTTGTSTPKKNYLKKYEYICLRTAASFIELSKIQRERWIGRKRVIIKIRGNCNITFMFAIFTITTNDLQY